MLILKHQVKKALKQYFEHTDIQNTANLYQLVISEVEKPLIESILEYTANNQTEAARVLGLSRNTLRKLINLYKL